MVRDARQGRRRRGSPGRQEQGLSGGSGARRLLVLEWGSGEQSKPPAIAIGRLEGRVEHLSERFRNLASTKIRPKYINGKGHELNFGNIFAEISSCCNYLVFVIQKRRVFFECLLV